MGDIIVSLKSGPFSGDTAQKIRESSELGQFLSTRDGELYDDPEENDLIWIEASEDCDDDETYDELCVLLTTLVAEGESFSIEIDTCMIGHMGIDEDSCGTRVTLLRMENGSLRELKHEWFPQDFS